MPSGEEHADECTWWLSGIKRERTSARPPSSRAREEAVEASDNFFSKGRNERRGCLTTFSERIEMDEEDAWTAFSKRKKRKERALGLPHQKGLKGMDGCA